jgi:molybdopterin molybdotransferase
MSNLPSLNSVVTCMSDYDPESLRVDQAIKIVQDFVRPGSLALATESVGIYDALGRVLAKDIISPINVPAADNSAMDGYAFAGSSIGSSESTTLTMIGKGLAGNAFEGQVGPGQCVRIMTGAVMPDGCDTMIAQEMVKVDGDQISFKSSAIKPGDNLGLIASLGIGTVEVKRRLRVGFFSTGDELRSIGENLDDGCVYDSNRYTLFGMLSRLGVELHDFGVVRDQPDAMRAAFSKAASMCDAVITSGGVSVGEADYTKQIMRELGDVSFWKIAMRPGRPMAFGSIKSDNHQAVLFGLPGNPVAVMVTFYQFVRNALLSMSGATDVAPLVMQAKTVEAIRKRPGRTEFQRGVLSTDATGTITVRITGAQGSGVLRSMSEADCFIVLEHDQDQIKAGDTVGVVLFEGLV